MGLRSHGHLELIGTTTGEVVPWEACNCLPWSRINVYVWRGKVESDREETGVKAGCAKGGGIGTGVLLQTGYPKLVTTSLQLSPGPIAIPGIGRSWLCLSTPA